MGRFLKKGNDGFRAVRNGEYVDKSRLIEIVNATLNTERQFTCVSRARRFGKSIGAEMLYAYYDQWCADKELFTDLQIISSPSFSRHFRRYPVLYLDLTDFVTRYNKSEDIVAHIQSDVIEELKEVFPDVHYKDKGNLADTLYAIVSQVPQEKFIMIVDEWDAILREWPEGSEASEQYINLLRGLFKSSNAKSTFAGVYMTGILPIKKYNTQSALNNFKEYSMVTSGAMARYFGFTKDEVKVLAERHGMDFDALEMWYDGYQIGPELSMFNPNSVMEAVRNEWCENYWSKTGAYDTVSDYIDMNYQGLRDDIIGLLSGGRAAVDPAGFSNDISEVRSRDDVLTVLIHLGYLTYDRREQECFIPNLEVAKEMENAIKANNWNEVVDALKHSKELLKATLRGDSDFVARTLQTIHSDETSILSYNDENSLACVISLAYYYARNDYHVHREYPTGEGYADLVLIPRKHVPSPALVIELKYNKSTQAAISQIKARNYPQTVADYTGDILLVGINYDKDTKQHECQIERWQKG